MQTRVGPGQVEAAEWSNYALAIRFKAAAMGLPFLPVRKPVDAYCACLLDCVVVNES